MLRKLLRWISQKFQSSPEEIICYQHGSWVRITRNHHLVYEGPIAFMPDEVRRFYKEHNSGVCWTDTKNTI